MSNFESNNAGDRAAAIPRMLFASSRVGFSHFDNIWQTASRPLIR